MSLSVFYLFFSCIFCCSWLFDMSWHKNTLMPCWHHWAIWNKEHKNYLIALYGGQNPRKLLGFLHFNTLKRAYFGIFFVTLSGPFFVLIILKSKPILEILRHKVLNILEHTFCQHYKEKEKKNTNLSPINVCWPCLFHPPHAVWLTPICQNYNHSFVI